MGAKRPQNRGKEWQQRLWKVIICRGVVWEKQMVVNGDRNGKIQELCGNLGADNLLMKVAVMKDGLTIQTK
jgi:hypothetical protein